MGASNSVGGTGLRGPPRLLVRAGTRYNAPEQFWAPTKGLHTGKISRYECSERPST